MNRWIVGARPRTLPAAIVPVALGGAAAAGESAAESAVWWRLSLALAVSLALQVGVNYANDYSDGVRGTDDVRVGPTRLVASRLASAAAVKRAAIGALACAALCGFVLAALTSWWLLVVGVTALAAAWFYTGGPRPYGYAGLGEVFVFVYFGIVATVGSTYAVTESTPGRSWIAGALAGSLACALLVINNLRDIPTDTASGKRTLAVRIGDRSTRRFYVGLLVMALVSAGVLAVERPAAALGLIGAAVMVPPALAVRRGVVGRELIGVLAGTGRAQLVCGLLTALGLAIGG